ncbi:hypothetical protein BS47DRAFT_1402308 [Hydnum rufescens UP504]|uniref:Uncharacterized protein n=1 Tax=Hydnum rufescens UP504 TaxID=1448309 RepID=A0A9P6AEP7_9AGAM|nr:hypothetical protein BS47DRAFT_1402308 [Hydnum rufescens UP504]
MDKDKQSSFPPQDLGLSPSGVPLQPVHIPDATLPDVSSDDMNIDDNPSTSHDHHVSDSQETSTGGSSSNTEPEWSPEANIMHTCATLRLVLPRLNSTSE